MTDDKLERLKVAGRALWKRHGWITKHAFGTLSTDGEAAEWREFRDALLALDDKPATAVERLRPPTSAETGVEDVDPRQHPLPCD